MYATGLTSTPPYWTRLKKGVEIRNTISNQRGVVTSDVSGWHHSVLVRATFTIKGKLRQRRVFWAIKNVVLVQ
jgi:hypothetical protein